MTENLHQKERRNKNHRRNTLRKLEEFGDTYPAEIVFRDGKIIQCYVAGVSQSSFETPSLLYGSSPLDPDTEYGSKLDYEDLWSKAPLNSIGYVRDPRTGRKISCLPFRESKKE